MKEINTVVIGGGMAGLACASILTERCIQCVVLEQSPVEGGNVVTHEGVDMGAGIIYDNFRFFKWLWKRSGHADQFVKFNAKTYPRPYSGTFLSFVNMCMENGVPLLSPYSRREISDKRVSDYMDFDSDMDMISQSIGSCRTKELHADLWAPLLFRSRKKLSTLRGMHAFARHLVTFYRLHILTRCIVIFVCETDDGGFVVEYIHEKQRCHVKCRNVVFATNPSKFVVTKCSGDTKSNGFNALNYTSVVSVLVKCDAVRMNGSVHLLDRDMVLQDMCGVNGVTVIHVMNSRSNEIARLYGKRSCVSLYISGHVDSARMNEIVRRVAVNYSTNNSKVHQNEISKDNSSIVKYIKFSEAVPLVFDLMSFNKLRCSQPNLRRFYCGQYMGPPTLETAVSSGVRAGFAVSVIPSIMRHDRMLSLKFECIEFAPLIVIVISIIVSIGFVVYGLVR